MRSRQIPGRYLGWSANDLATKPYARFYNPQMAPLPAHALEALARGPVADAMLPSLEDSPAAMFGKEAVLENAYTLTADGGMRVNILTDMPGVTPAMIDWWFGWHGDEAAKYKLWHPQAHVHVRWLKPVPESAKGRARYVGHTSIVDEYIGEGMIRGAIRFVEPKSLGFTDTSLDDPAQATIVCARTGLADLPVDVGHLAHHVRRTAQGSEMRSRFWFGGPHVAGRGGPLASVQATLAKSFNRFTDRDARNLLSHCAQEMQHLATFLPALHASEGARPR